MTERAGGRLARIPLPWLLTPYVVLWLVGLGADVAGPHLINEHPLLQMTLNPRNRYLILAAPNVDAVPYFVIGFIRLVLTDPIGFVIGWYYGERAISWAERYIGDEAGIIRKIEGWFGKIAPLVIFVAPSFYWCILAGAGRMSVRLFVALNVTGTIARLVLFRIAGDAFREELDSVLDWVGRYQWWLMGLMAVVVALQLFRSGPTAASPTELAAELEGAEPHPHRGDEDA